MKRAPASTDHAFHDKQYSKILFKLLQLVIDEQRLIVKKLKFWRLIIR